MQITTLWVSGGKEPAGLPRFLLVAVVTEQFFVRGEQKPCLLEVMCGMARQARELLMTGILSHEVQMTLTAARTHRLDASFPEAKDLAGVAVTVDVRRSGTVAGLAPLLPGMISFEQRLVG